MAASNGPVLRSYPRRATRLGAASSVAVQEPVGTAVSLLAAEGSATAGTLKTVEPAFLCTVFRRYRRRASCASGRATVREAAVRWA